MVVREDGTKWACQSCLKGHRVSGCTHTDRELTLVPKKGRPVTQCQHCRLERKKRAAHVKCDCGEADKPHHPKEKCIHLREAEERAKVGYHDDFPDEQDLSVLAMLAEEQGCCCHHDGPCSCTTAKRDADRTSTTPPHGPAVHKPRLEPTRSDESFTVFANGHHKPVHRKNHAAHECGMPYKMPIPRNHPDQPVPSAARRSVDNLALDPNDRTNPDRVVDGSALGMSFNGPPLQTSPSAPFNPHRRLSKSEQPSPRQTAIDQINGWSDSNLASLDFASLGPVQTNQSIESMDSLAFSPMESMSGMADSTYDPWSALPSSEANSLPNNNPFTVWATTYDNGNLAQPALTAASSGTQSEIDEIPPAGDELYGFPMPSIQEDPTAVNVNLGVSPDLSANRRSLPPNFFSSADFGLPRMANEWQMPVADLVGPDESKAKPAGSDATQDLELDGSWPTTPMTPSLNGVVQRSSAGSGLANPAGRPHSVSVGPSSAPDYDIIKQLFPGIDLESAAVFGSPSLAAAASPIKQRPLSRSLGNPTSAPMTFSSPSSSSSATMHADGAPGNPPGFLSQAWSDGSISVPNDSFTSPYALDQEFSDPDFADAAWPDR